MYKIGVLLLILLSICSCVRDDFFIDSANIYRNIDIEVDRGGNVLAYKEYASLNALFSDDELSYSFRIKSPDGDLAWEGDFFSGSAELGLTDGASFQSGIYTMIAYADNGTDINTDITLSEHDDSYPYINGDGVLITDTSVTIVEYDGNQNEIKKEEDIMEYKIDSNSKSVAISYVDRYLNRITTHQYF